MIPYTVDRDTRVYFFIGFVVLAIVLALTLDEFSQALFLKVLALVNAPPEFMHRIIPFSLSFTFYFSGIRFVFNRWIWKIGLIQQLTGIIDLSGVWEGVFHRVDYIGDKTENNIPAELIIKQTFSKISIKYSSVRPGRGRSRSDATLAGLYIENDHAPRLVYVFQFREGKGLQELELSKDAATDAMMLSGWYVSSMPRKGEINVTRTSKRKNTEKTNNQDRK